MAGSTSLHGVAGTGHVFSEGGAQQAPRERQVAGTATARHAASGTDKLELAHREQ